LLTSTSARLCAGIRADGQRCRARATAGHDFCSFHRGDLQDTFQEGRVRGGSRRRYLVTSGEEEVAVRLCLGLDSRGGIQAGLETLLRLAFFDQIDPRCIPALTRIYATALRNIDQSERNTGAEPLADYTAGLALNHRFHLSLASASRAAESTRADTMARTSAETERAILQLLENLPA
jgi:hypothetical protein